MFLQSSPTQETISYARNHPYLHIRTRTNPRREVVYFSTALHCWTAAGGTGVTDDNDRADVPLSVGEELNFCPR